MSESPPKAPATREAWKTSPLPLQRARLDFAAEYSAVDFQRIRLGSIPQQMEDKWFIFYEAPWLFLHRSWTGYCIYAIRFQDSAAGAKAVESWVSRDAKQYSETRLDHDRAFLDSLIRGLLLG
jgi:hypothetical protein